MAATVAGVVSLSDAVKVVEARAEICNKLGGIMTAVRAPVEKVKSILSKHESLKYDIACVNGSRTGPIILAGDESSIQSIEEIFQAENVGVKRLTTHGAFHSRFLDPHLSSFENVLLSVELLEPTMPIISTAHGQYLTSTQATSHAYWVSQLRDTVQFSNALFSAKESLPHAVLIEVGPGTTLSVLAQNEHDVMLSENETSYEKRQLQESSGWQFERRGNYFLLFARSFAIAELTVALDPNSVQDANWTGEEFVTKCPSFAVRAT